MSDPENQDSDWLLFEAGALSKAVDKAHVCPYLIDLTPSDVNWPLAQFQSRRANKDGTFDILKAINAKLPANQLSDKHLERAFSRFYPDLEGVLANLPDSETHKPKDDRKDREILEEVLELTRSMVRSGTVWPTFSAATLWPGMTTTTPDPSGVTLWPTTPDPSGVTYSIRSPKIVITPDESPDVTSSSADSEKVEPESSDE